jgi:hypothetical protein
MSTDRTRFARFRIYKFDAYRDDVADAGDLFWRSAGASQMTKLVAAKSPSYPPLEGWGRVEHIG